MTREDQPDTHGKWYPEIENLIGHASKVCEMHGANTVPPEFDLARVKAACSRAQELLSLTPVEAAPIIAEMQNQIELPPNVGEDDHMLRSELYHVIAAKLSLKTLQSEAPDIEVAHGQQYIDPAEHGDELRQMLGEVTSLLRTIEERTGTVIEATPDFDTQKTEWQSRKEELQRTVVDGGSFTLAGPGMTFPAISAIAELLYMHLKPMIEINVRVMAWYATELKRRATEIIDQASLTVEEKTKTIIDAISKTSLSVVEKILVLLKKVRAHDTGLEDEYLELNPEDTPEERRLPLSDDHHEVLCANITGDRLIISSTKHGVLVDDTLQIAMTGRKVVAAGEAVRQIDKSEYSRVTVETPISETHVGQGGLAVALLRELTKNKLLIVDQGGRLQYAIPTSADDETQQSIMQALGRATGRMVVPINKTVALAVGHSEITKTRPVIYTEMFQSETDIVVSKEGKRRYGSTLEIGWNTLDSDIVRNAKLPEGHRLTAAQARRLRYNISQAYADGTVDSERFYQTGSHPKKVVSIEAYSEATRETVIAWIEHIDKVKRAYERNTQGQLIKEIYVLGAHRWLPLLKTELSAKTQARYAEIERFAFEIQVGLHKMAFGHEWYET